MKRADSPSDEHSGALDISANDCKGLNYIRDHVLYQGKTPTLQAISDHVGFKTRRAASLLIERLIKAGYLANSGDGLRIIKGVRSIAGAERTVAIPLVGSAPCGTPLFAEENIEATINVSQRIARPGAAYFLLRAVGDSMDKAGIMNGDFVLVRKQHVAHQGDRVVALIDDQATIKVFQQKNNKVMLLPKSSNPAHQPIILDSEFMVQGIVVDAIPKPD